jgi:hypothetical protein
MKGAPIAEESRRGGRQRAHSFELALDVEYRALRAAPSSVGASSGKAATEHDASRLRQDLDVLAEVATCEL